MTPTEACQRISAHRLVPVVRAPTEELALQASEALIQGGIRVFEVTLTVPGAVRVIDTLTNRHESGSDPVVVGAGTVLDDKSAAECIKAGARFIVSPGLDLPTVELCKKLEVAVMPGCLTPTEVITGWKAGADMIKIFPCSALGGASYLKALKAPLPEVKLLPTGGVNLKTAASFLEAGAEALGVGANLVDIKALQSDGPDALIARAREYLNVLK